MREQMDTQLETSETEDREAFKTRLGWCYRENALYVQMHVDMQLVHGSIQGAGHPRISHAWCINPDGSVHDAVLGQDMPQIVHERMFSAKVDVIFTRDEVFEHIRRQKHWGPWT